MITDEARQSEAWDLACYAEGTRVVFQRRADSLRRKTQIRDFLGLAVPICLAYLLGTEVFAPLKPYREWGIGALYVFGVLQTLMVAWSLLARWDEELAYSIRAVRESYMLKENWKKIAKGDVANLHVEYDIISEYQRIDDSHNTEKSITEEEKRIGMRAALIEFQRPCVCGKIPKTSQPPYPIEYACTVCGGN